ncbi:relaxase/mobilization nuclease domain-containing protein [Anaerobiospirillum sp. NML120449]|uniref:relaxase/mobilization nuclease domain-containing protein n=1 Tax=Anaerobiospirillum sp. NML120449 TaxID=2932817 RepID=UPI001FF4B83B|nr:relaxase/mobilization nuclease domain-containing protein [Anaerobiospirillum sp. NML120449]MCK0525385.1 relaxase/mobilization nuclease domain-containing protein [Anaerobiospirillum sp. NML120449]
MDVDKNTAIKIAREHREYVRRFREAEKLISRVLPYPDEPDIFKPIKRVKLRKQAGGGGSFTYLTRGSGWRSGWGYSSSKSASTSARSVSEKRRSRTVNSNYRKSHIYKKGTGISAVQKAKGIVNSYKEAVIKIDRASKGIKTASHLHKAASYIIRNGKVLPEGPDGSTLSKERLYDLIDEWANDMAIAESKDSIEYDNNAPAAARRFILSAPPGTNHDAMMRTARQFGREFFGENGFDYVYVMHAKTEDTPNEPDHPHVHFLIKSVNNQAQRLNIRKKDLKFMRERFAALAMLNGISMNATDRAVRGVARSNTSIEKHYINLKAKTVKEEPVWTNGQLAARARIKQSADSATREMIEIDDPSINSLAKGLQEHFSTFSNELPDEISTGEFYKSFIAMKKKAAKESKNMRENTEIRNKESAQSQAQKWAIERRKKELSRREKERLR